jgi:DNA-binding PadR family transcriptional regulator
VSIKYAILGLLREQTSHGYAVRAAFEERLGDVWELNYGQVYQVLTALEQEGLILASDERVGKRPPRRVYSISPKGRDALRKWLLQPSLRRRPYRDDFYLRLLFAAEWEPDLVRGMIEDEGRRCREQLAALTDQAGLAEGDGTEATVRWLFTKAASLHAEADVKALELCRAVLEKRAQCQNDSRAEEERPASRTSVARRGAARR